MWTSTIVGKRFENGALYVDVQYYNGDASIARTIDLTGGSLDVLSIKIQSQLDTLNATEALAEQIIVGEFTPDIPVEKSDALTELRKLKDLVNLGVLEEDDPKITAALIAVKQESSTRFEVVK